jgi:hypothetical protein
MTTTTSYGSWTTADPGNTTLEDSVAVALGDYVDDYDFDGLCEAYRDAINAQLPDEVTLNGSEFYGPYEGRQRSAALVKAAVAVVEEEFWNIAAQFDRSAT